MSFFLQVNAVNLTFNPIAKTENDKRNKFSRVASLPEQVFYLPHLMSSPDVQCLVVREGPVAAPLQASHQIPAGNIHLRDSGHVAVEKKFQKNKQKQSTNSSRRLIKGLAFLSCWTGRALLNMFY